MATSQVDTDGAAILHIGSVFVSSANVTPDRRVEFRRAFNSVIDIALERDVDAVVQAGKLFATRSPTRTDIENLRKQLQRLSDAEITFINAGSERDADMELVADLQTDGLLERPDTEPVRIRNTAIYRIPPVDNLSELGQLASYYQPDPDIQQTLLAAPRTTTPPVENGDFKLEEFVGSVPFNIDVLLLGNSRNKYLETHTDTEGPSVFAAGPTEINLRKRLLRKQAEYPCHVGILKPTGEYEPITLPHNELKVFHIDCPSDAKLSEIKELLELSGDNSISILVGLRGKYESRASFPSEDLEEWLNSVTDVYKVWDDRDTVNQSNPTGETVSVTTHYSSVEESDTEELQMDAIPDAVAGWDSLEQSHGQTESEQSQPATDEIASEGTPEPDAPTAPMEAANSEFPSIYRVDDSDGVDVELQPDRGTHVDPTDHYAGADLEKHEFATVEPTDEDGCGYQLNCRRLDRETDQRITLTSEDGVWQCPHPTYENGRCVFHHQDAEPDAVENELKKCLKSDNESRREFIGATFPDLDLSNEKLGEYSNDPIDFRYASFADELRMTGCTVLTPMKIDGAQFRGVFDISDADVQAGISAHETWFKNSVVADSSIYHGRITFSGSLIEGTLRINSATFENNLILSHSTIVDELVMTRCECSGQFAGFSFHAIDEVYGQQSVFKHDVRFENARFEHDVNFENARFESFIDLARTEFDPTALLNGQSMRVANTIQLANADFGDVDFSNAKISGPVDYGDTTINGDFTAQEAVFRGGFQQTTDRSQADAETPLHVDGNLSLVKARFLRDVDLNLTVAREVDCSGIYTSALLHIVGHAQSIKLSGGLLEGALEYSVNTEQEVDLSEIDLSGKCSLFECNIGTNLDLSNATIGREISISTVSIAGELVDLSHCQLSDTIRINNSDLPTVQLKNSRLEDAFYVTLTSFENVDLSNTTVKGQLKWKNPTISEQLLLNDASFHDVVNIDTSTSQESDVEPHADTGAKLDGHINNRITIGEIEAPNALFKNRVEISTVSYKIFINEIYAEGKVDFKDSSADNLDARGITIKEKLRIKNASIQYIELIDSDVDTLECISVAADEWSIKNSQIDTITIHRADKLNIKTVSQKLIIDAQRTELNRGTISITESLYIDLTDATIGSLRFTEVHGGPLGETFLSHIRFYRTIFDGFRIGELPGLSTHFELHTFDVSQAEYEYDEPTPAGLITTYRRAKNGAAAVGDRTAEGKFFEQEKEYLGEQYKTDDHLTELWKNRLWRLSAGYGESPARVVIFSGMTIVIFALLFPLVQAIELLISGRALGQILSQFLSGTLLPGDYGTPIGWILLSAESFTTLVLGPTPVESTLLRIFAAVEGFVGAFLIALFLFTLTKSIDR